MLDEPQKEMLKANGEECAGGSVVRNEVDPHFHRERGVLMLARRMVEADMLYRCESKEDEVGLFCLMKEAGIVEAEPSVSLGRVFDQRQSDLRWRPPP